MRDRRRTPSSTVALGAATMFLAVAAAVSFIVDDGSRLSAGLGHGWTLRGTLVPGAEAHGLDASAKMVTSR